MCLTGTIVVVEIRGIMLGGGVWWWVVVVVVVGGGIAEPFSKQKSPTVKFATDSFNVCFVGQGSGFQGEEANSVFA